MKKIFLYSCINLMFLVFADLCFCQEFSWAKYEAECWKNGITPTFEQYEELCNNPQCYGDCEAELNRIFAESEEK